ncbi:MAG: hypothetical protein H0X34_17045 [Chthoniobacterales bacterium]|nr:hypothetical protein [Chthoniobacterales bacterium]
MKAPLLGACLLLAAPCAACAQDFVDRIDQALTISTFHDEVRARLSGLLDLEYYNFSQPPPGLIRADGHDILTPRLSMFLDAQLGSRVYFFAQARFDQGFDPSDRGRTQVRLDEYALRVTPWSDGRFALQVGKFATVVGGWIERHHSWDNPFINAPLSYETATLVSDKEVPLTGQSFRAVPGFDKYEFLPIIWGPVYTHGASIAGRVGIFEYAAEIKNAPVASRPETWNDYDFGHPAIDLRVGLRPNPAWRFGLSAAEGSYLKADARPLQDAGSVGEYRQYLLGQDISYARGHLQIWAEAFESRFEIPRLGDSDVFAYYLEAKYKLTPQLFGALRWNQEWFASGRDPAGQPVANGHDIWRAEAAFGYRFTEHTQLKLQYSLVHGDFVSENLNGTFLAQFTIRFLNLSFDGKSNNHVT